MKRLERKWKRIFGWTAFICMLIAVITMKWAWTINQQESLREQIRRNSRNPPPHQSPSEPDASVQEISKEELSDLLENATQGWDGAAPEKREQALMSRIEEMAQMEPERVEGVVDHLLALSGAEVLPERRVELEELDLNSIVPVNMVETVSEDGKAVVVMEVQDAQGQISEVRLAPEEMTPEEQQALRAFRLMNQVPALHRLRPLLTPLLRQE
jgi:hypothetical protein